MFILGYSEFLPLPAKSINQNHGTDSIKRKLDDIAIQAEARILKRRLSLDRSAFISQVIPKESNLLNETHSHSITPGLSDDQIASMLTDVSEEASNRSEDYLPSLSDDQIAALLTDVSEETSNFPEDYLDIFRDLSDDQIDELLADVSEETSNSSEDYRDIDRGLSKQTEAFVNISQIQNSPFPHSNSDPAFAETALIRIPISATEETQPNEEQSLPGLADEQIVLLSKRSKKRWQEDEIAILIKYKNTPSRCLKGFFPHRSRASIANKQSKLGLAKPSQPARPIPRPGLPSINATNSFDSEWDEKEIRMLEENKDMTTTALQEKFFPEKPLSSIYRKRKTLNYKRKANRGELWSQNEIKILHENSHLPDEKLALMLPGRSAGAVKSKIANLREPSIDD